MLGQQLNFLIMHSFDETSIKRKGGEMKNQ